MGSSMDIGIGVTGGAGGAGGGCDELAGTSS